MEIKTAEGGHRSVASQGLGVWGAVGGALGTLALVNQLGVGGGALFGAPFGNACGARGFGGFGGYGCGGGYAGGYPINNLTAGLAAVDVALAVENSTLRSEKYSDNKDDKIWQKYCELDKEIALNKQATEFLFRIANDNIRDVYRYADCNFVKNQKVLNACKIVGGVTADGYTMNLPTVPTDPFCGSCGCVPVTAPITPPTAE